MSPLSIALLLIVLIFAGPALTLACLGVKRAIQEGPGGSGPMDVGECDFRIPEVVHSVKNEGLK